MEESNVVEASDNLRLCLPKILRPPNSGLPHPVYKIHLDKRWIRTGESLPTIDTKDDLAVKFALSDEDKDVNQLREEYRLLTLVTSNNKGNIVSVFQLFENIVNELPFFVMECGERSLERFLIKSEMFPTAGKDAYQKDASYYTIRRCLIWLRQIALALEYLHEKGILHRDLKPGNVLLFDGSKLCKLCDFGNSTDVMKTHRTANRGTSHYMAPEMRSTWEEVRKYTHKADCYSFGILMHECLCTRKPPTADFSLPNESMFGKDADKEFEFDRLKELMKRLTSAQVERPEIGDVNKTLQKIPELDAEELPELTTGMPKLPMNETDDNRRQRSLDRACRTIYYSVSSGNVPGVEHPASNNEERCAIGKTLDGILRQINKKAAEHYKMADLNYYKVNHVLNVYGATIQGEFCQVEHTIRCSNEEHTTEVFVYCSTVTSHTSWLEDKFKDDPDEILRNVKFRVDNECRTLDTMPVRQFDALSVSGTQIPQ